MTSRNWNLYVELQEVLLNSSLSKEVYPIFRQKIFHNKFTDSDLGFGAKQGRHTKCDLAQGCKRRQNHRRIVIQRLSQILQKEERAKKTGHE